MLHYLDSIVLNIIVVRWEIASCSFAIAKLTSSDTIMLRIVEAYKYLYPSMVEMEVEKIRG